MMSESDEEFRRLLRSVDESAAVPSGFEERLWGELRRTLTADRSVNAGYYSVSDTASASADDPADFDIVLIEVDRVDLATQRTVIPRLALAVAASIIVLLTAAYMIRGDENPVVTIDSAALGSSDPDDSSEPDLAPVIAEPGLACERYDDTVGTSPEEVDRLLQTTPAGWQQTIDVPLERFEDALALLARDLAAAEGVEGSTVTSFELARGAVGQLRLEVEAGNVSAARNTLASALGRVEQIGVVLLDQGCGGLVGR